ncbi:MAG: BACON domain-containing protein, partial [Candidatus Aminicenantes bacterium]
MGCKKTPTTPDVESLTSPVIWLNLSEISFTAQERGSNPGSKTLQVKNSGQKTLDYTVAVDTEWLSVEPEKGSSTGETIEHTVSVDKSGMEGRDEDYTATITVSCGEAYNNPQQTKVSLKLEKEPPPKIWVSTNELSFNGEQGGNNPSSQSIEVKNTGEGTLDYKISDDAAWLEVKPINGMTDGGKKTHNVSVDIGGLSAGSLAGTITISDNKASNSPKTVSVSLTVTEKPPPKIRVSPNALSFSGEEGGSSPSSQSIAVKNSGEQTLDYSISDDADWLSVIPKNGSSQGEENNHTVSVDIAGLSQGSYSAAITISDAEASNSPQTVDVTLSLSQQTPPQIWVSDTSLSFSGKEGGSNPSSQSIDIKNSGEQTLNYSISDNKDWLSVSPTSGSSQGEENSHTVSVDISGLSAGSYSGTITITDDSASNSPQTVDVSLTVSQQQPPQIWVSTSSLSFSAQEGSASASSLSLSAQKASSNPSSQDITIKNSGEQTLNYSISDNKDWLSVSPTSGSSQGEENSHTVSVDISGLSAGSYSGTITITDDSASNSP